MPRKCTNTERGSSVALHKRKRADAMRTLLLQKAATPSLSLSSLAHTANLSARVAQKRWKKMEAARVAGLSHDAALSLALSDNRGGSNRSFTSIQEQLLAELVRNSIPSLTHSQIHTEALRFKRDCVVAASHDSSRHLRSSPPLSASAGFISGFKRRQRLSSHRTAIVHTSNRDMNRDMELEKIAFVVEVRECIDTFGAGRVLNMDETPVVLLDVSVTAVVSTGRKEAAKIHTSVNVGRKITTFTTVSAVGDKLQLCAIFKGRTERTLSKIRDGASADTKKVRLYYSDKGWVNEGIMLQYLRDVIQPFTHSQPSALILDSYRSHFTPAVQQAAAEMNLRLIQVPGGCTAELQPLDVNFNGAFVMARKHIWTEKKLLDPHTKDSEQAAIERAQQAYDKMQKAMIVDAFRRSSLLD